jgi:hypothetical protein
MKITEVRIKIINETENSNLKAEANITFDNLFVIHGVKIIENLNSIDTDVEEHIIENHGPNSTVPNKSKFNNDFNIIKGINESDFSNQSISKKIVDVNGEYYKNFWESYGNYPCVFSAVNQSKLTDLINAMKSVSEEIVKTENSEVIEKIKEFRKEESVGVKNLRFYLNVLGLKTKRNE